MHIKCIWILFIYSFISLSNIDLSSTWVGINGIWIQAGYWTKCFASTASTVFHISWCIASPLNHNLLKQYNPIYACAHSYHTVGSLVLRSTASAPPPSPNLVIIKSKGIFYDFLAFRKMQPLVRNLTSSRRRKVRIVFYRVIMPCGLVVVYTGVVNHRQQF